MDATATPEWQSLKAHYETISGRHLRELFAEDPERATRFTAEGADLVLDYSKHRVTDETLRLLMDVARAARVEEHRDAMFSGKHINTTEDRAVLHVALRMPPGTELVVDGQDVTGDVHTVLAKMGELSERIRNGSWTGATGKRIGAVVNIGIGGSDLGPAMATAALADYAQPGLVSRFVSNVDPVDLYAATHDLDPASTLFVVSSKTFTTLETLTNAAAARDWLLRGLGAAAGPDAVAKHFVAVSTNATAVAEFGIDTSNMLEFWDWVGGRYSYDSAIGFSLMVAIGRQAFGEMLFGFHSVDEHFRTAPLAENLPVIQGMLNVWYDNFFGAQTHAVLPYSHRLARFPAYLQQLTMESNGKSVRLDGTPVDGADGRDLLGRAGHQRAARLLPAAAPGHEARPGRLHRLRGEHARDGRTARPPRGQLPGADQGPRLRQDGRGDRSRGHTSRAGAAQGDARQPSQLHHPRPEAHPVGPGAAGGALRAHRVRRGHGVGHRLLRPVGCRARQGDGEGAGTDPDRPRRPPISPRRTRRRRRWSAATGLCGGGRSSSSS